MLRVPAAQDTAFFVVEIWEGCWLATWRGDPGRTVVLASARRYRSSLGSKIALGIARRYRPLRDAQVIPISVEEYERL